MKRLARQGIDGPLEQGIATELPEVPVKFDSVGVKEGIAAFRTRRELEFA